MEGAVRASQIWESPVLQSVLPVVDAPQHVRISEEAIRQVAKWMAYEEFTPIGSGPSGEFRQGGDRHHLDAHRGGEQRGCADLGRR
ncbi:MAG: hypothetical protein ACKN93_01115, partial [Candidatus Limnocylindrus sp.]